MYQEICLFGNILLPIWPDFSISTVNVCRWFGRILYILWYPVCNDSWCLEDACWGGMIRVDIVLKIQEKLSIFLRKQICRWHLKKLCFLSHYFLLFNVWNRMCKNSRKQMKIRLLLGSNFIYEYFRTGKDICGKQLISDKQRQIY